MSIPSWGSGDAPGHKLASIHSLSSEKSTHKVSSAPSQPEKGLFQVGHPHHTHLGLKGSSTDNIAITSCPEQACVSKGLRTRAASSGLLSHPGNSVGVRGCSQHTIRAEHRGQATMCNCTTAHPPCCSAPGAELASQQLEFAETPPSDLALLQLQAQARSQLPFS